MVEVYLHYYLRYDYTFRLSNNSHLQVVHESLESSYTRFNRLTPNDPYLGRTAPLTSKRCILYVYSTNLVLNILNMFYKSR